MDLSVIIPHFNDSMRLRECLACLAAQQWPGHPSPLLIEVLVVDNGSSDVAAVESAVSVHEGLAILLHEDHPGSYAARNAALKVARGKYLAFTDSDCLPDVNWLAKAIVALEADPPVGMVAGKIDVFPRDPKRPTAVELYEMVTAFNQQAYLTKRNFGATANVVTRRSVMDVVGGFNSELMSGGDAEWGRREAEAGFGQRYAPEAIVRHPARRELKELVNKSMRVVGSGESVSKEPRSDLRRFLLIIWNNTLQIPASGFTLASDSRLDNVMCRLKVFAVHLVVRYASTIERIRLMVGGRKRR